MLENKYGVTEHLRSMELDELHWPIEYTLNLIRKTYQEFCSLFRRIIDRHMTTF